MPRIPAALALALALCALSGCSPTFNWRDVRVEPTTLKAMLPCKPDEGAREVPMAGRQVQLQVLGCEAGGATFAIMSADIVDPARAGDALAQWKAATLANMRSSAARETPFRPGGVPGLRESLQVVATGQRADGSRVESHAVYFAHDTHVFQAVIYSDRLKPDVADTFFSGLRFE